MRIVGGALKSRALRAPAGRGTRPTSDRAREGAFNILAHASWAPPLNGARVMDAFAGSGALGFEAMSRGAAFCLFVETDAGARGVIRENAETLGLTGVVRIHRRDACALGTKPAGLGAPFELAFLDPPYGHKLATPALEALAAGQWLSDAAAAIVETGADEGFEAPGGWSQEDERQYGEARFVFLSRDADVEG